MDLRRLDLMPDKPFNPHLTLGRNKSGGSKRKIVSFLNDLNELLGWKRASQKHHAL